MPSSHYAAGAPPAAARGPRARRSRRHAGSGPRAHRGLTTGRAAASASRSAAAESIRSPRSRALWSTWLRERGAEPFVIPAMGSHGGATPDGQRELLASYGITSETLGVPVRAEMDTDEVGRTTGGIPVRLSRVAREADAVVLVNRIKPHTDFESTTLGSGLLKMAAIGLGKIDGASACHEGAARLGLRDGTHRGGGRRCSAALPRVYGVGLVEDGTHRLARIAVLRGDEIAREEPALLQQARAWMPALPFRRGGRADRRRHRQEHQRRRHGPEHHRPRRPRRAHDDVPGDRAHDLRAGSDAGVARQRHRHRAGRRRLVASRRGDGPGDHLHECARRDEGGSRAHPVPVRHGRGLPRVPHAAWRASVPNARASCGSGTRWRSSTSSRRSRTWRRSTDGMISRWLRRPSPGRSHPEGAWRDPRRSTRPATKKGRHPAGAALLDVAGRVSTSGVRCAGGCRRRHRRSRRSPAASDALRSPSGCGRPVHGY